MVLSVKPSRTYVGSIPTKVRALVRPVKRATPKNAFGLAPLGIETANPEKWASAWYGRRRLFKQADGDQRSSQRCAVRKVLNFIIFLHLYSA